MTYSCTDFADTILDALHIDVPEDSWDSPSDQADLVLERLKSFHTALKRAKYQLESFADGRKGRRSAQAASCDQVRGEIPRTPLVLSARWSLYPKRSLSHDHHPTRKRDHDRKHPPCHCTRTAGEVRVYPLGSGGNLILCHSCWAHENRYRYERGRETGDPANWPQVNWNAAEVVS